MPKTVEKKTKKTTNPKATKKGDTKDNSKELAEIKQLQKELENSHDKHIRLKAEFDNFRRRKMEEIAKLLQYDGENVIKGFLSIIDDLERMLAASDASEESLKNGMEMVASKIDKFLDSIKVIPFGEKGDEMDSDIHDAMMTQTDEEADDHTILSVFEKGYTYREKVIRHAKVIVNKR